MSSNDRVSIAKVALQNIEDGFNKKAISSVVSKAKFFSTLRIYNSKTDNIKTPEFNFEWEVKYNEIYYKSKFNYIHAKAIDNNMTPVFLTLTLPTEYHQFKQISKKDKRIIFNPKYDINLSINQSYKKLNDVFRHLYNNFKVYVGEKMVHIKTKFIKVTEPHKDFTPHLHAVIYVPKEYLTKFRKHFDNVIDKHRLKQCDYEILNQTLKNKYGAINYLLKYVGKTLGNNATFMGWRQIHKIRLVTTSNIPYTRKIYDVYMRNVGWNRISKNVFFQMEEDLTVISHSCQVEKDYVGTFKSRNDLLKQLIVEDKFNKKEIMAKCEKYRYIDYKIITVKPKNEFAITFEDEKKYLYETRYKYDDIFLRPDLGYDTIGEFDEELGLFVPVVEVDEFYSYNTEFGDDETIERVGCSKEKIYSEIMLYQTLSSSCAVGGTKIYDKSDYSVVLK